MYKPEIKGAPAFSAIFKIEDVESHGDKAQSTARKSFFNCSSCDMIWSPKGGSALILVTADVDRTNSNYYGSQQLYYLSANGAVEQRVELGKEGPIYDFDWSPKGDSFIVVYGLMPAKVSVCHANARIYLKVKRTLLLLLYFFKSGNCYFYSWAQATLYNGKTCEPKFDFGVGPRNMAKINTFGRLAMLAGFGNLPGRTRALWILLLFFWNDVDVCAYVRDRGNGIELNARSH